MSNSVIAKLKALIGEDNVLENTSEMAKYLKGNGKPLAVVLPGSDTDVAGIVKLANEWNLKVTVGGLVVETKGLNGGLAMVMVRMNRILEIDHENLVAVVEPGISHKEFLQKVTEEGLYFAPEPYNSITGSLGGCFAIGDADSKSFNFGPTRTHILGWEMVVPTGELLKVGNKCIKNVSGYDLIHFMVGSKGSLGIFTKLIVKLFPKPEAKRAVLANFESLQTAGSVITKLTMRGVYPTRVNLLNWSLAKTVVAKNPQLPFASGYVAMVDLEGFTQSTMNLAEDIAATFKLAGAKETVIIKDCESYESIWDGWLLAKAQHNDCELVEFSVGPANFAKGLKGFEDIVGDANGAPGMLAYGLSGNISIVLPDVTQYQKDAMLDKISALALSLGGSISGVQGLYLRAKAYNEPDLYEELTNLLGRIRKEFDPKGILAPGIDL